MATLTQQPTASNAPRPGQVWQGETIIKVISEAATPERCMSFTDAVVLVRTKSGKKVERTYSVLWF